MTDRLNHTHLAALLDRAHAATVELNRALALAGLASSPTDSPRRYALTALEQLAGTRKNLDRIAVAAGFASPYVRRDLKPKRSYTRAAEREAHPWPYTTSDHVNLGRVRRRGFVGPSSEDCGTGDGDCPASLHESENEFAPVPPPSAAHAPPDLCNDHDNAKTPNALSGLRTAI